MIKFDLHGSKHSRVRSTLIRQIEDLWGTEADLMIVTGHSPRMKEIVKEVLEEYKLEYTVGGLSGVNCGYIRTFI